MLQLKEHSVLIKPLLPTELLLRTDFSWFYNYFIEKSAFNLLLCEPCKRAEILVKFYAVKYRSLVV
jgi:hypothetical protein